jgi:hypothetical protein
MKVSTLFYVTIEFSGELRDSRFTENIEKAAISFAAVGY